MFKKIIAITTLVLAPLMAAHALLPNYPQFTVTVGQVVGAAPFATLEFYCAPGLAATTGYTKRQTQPATDVTWNPTGTFADGDYSCYVAGITDAASGLARTNSNTVSFTVKKTVTPTISVQVK